MNIIFVYNEELKGGMQDYSQPTKVSDVNVRAQQLRKNYSRDFSSIRRGPMCILEAKAQISSDLEG